MGGRVGAGGHAGQCGRGCAGAGAPRCGAYVGVWVWVGVRASVGVRRLYGCVGARGGAGVWVCYCVCLFVFFLYRQHAEHNTIYTCHCTPPRSDPAASRMATI